jgi:hypothetical protein
MANVPEQQSINSSDYKKEDQETVSRMSGVINDFITQAISALNKNLTFGENFRSYTTELPFSQTSKTLTYKYQGSGTPSHVFITKLSLQPQTAVTPYWTHDGKGNITVTLIGDLSTAGPTTTTLLAISE